MMNNPSTIIDSNGNGNGNSNPRVYKKLVDYSTRRASTPASCSGGAANPAANDSTMSTSTTVPCSPDLGYEFVSIPSPRQQQRQQRQRTTQRRRASIGCTSQSNHSPYSKTRTPPAFLGHDSTATFGSPPVHEKLQRRNTMSMNSSCSRRPLLQYDPHNESGRDLLQFAVNAGAKNTGTFGTKLLRPKSFSPAKGTRAMRRASASAAVPVPVAPQLDLDWDTSVNAKATCAGIAKLHDSISTFATTATKTRTTQAATSTSRFDESWNTLNYSGHDNGTGTATGTNTGASSKERRTKMNWLANNAPKRDLHSFKANAPPSTKLKVIYPKGKEPTPTTMMDAAATATDSVNNDGTAHEQAQTQLQVLDYIAELEEEDEEGKASFKRLPPKAFSLEERRQQFREAGVVGTAQKQGSKDDLHVGLGSIDISISLKTLTGQMPKVAASTRRRSSTSFVAGSQIRTYSVVY